MQGTHSIRRGTDTEPSRTQRHSAPSIVLTFQLFLVGSHTTRGKGQDGQNGHRNVIRRHSSFAAVRWRNVRSDDALDTETRMKAQREVRHRGSTSLGTLSDKAKRRLPASRQPLHALMQKVSLHDGLHGQELRIRVNPSHLTTQNTRVSPRTCAVVALVGQLTVLGPCAVASCACVHNRCQKFVEAYKLFLEPVLVSLTCT